MSSIIDKIKIMASSSNFLHLTGVKLNKDIKDNSAETFFENARDGKLKEEEFDFKDNTTEQKLNILSQSLKVASNAKMIGDYNENRLKLQTDKLAGSVYSCIGFVKSGKYYVPNTVLETDIRKEVNDTKRVLAVLSKKIGDEKYNVIESVAKKIDINLLLKKIENNIPISKELLNSSQEQTVGIQNIQRIEFKELPNVTTNNEAVLPKADVYSLLSDVWTSIKRAVKSLFKQDNSGTFKQSKNHKKSPSNKPKSSVKTVDKSVSQQRKKSTEISKKVQKTTPEKSVHNTPEKPVDRPYFTREMLKKEAARISREYRENPRPQKEKSHSHEIE